MKKVRQYLATQRKVMHSWALKTDGYQCCIHLSKLCAFLCYKRKAADVYNFIGCRGVLYFAVTEIRRVQNNDDKRWLLRS